MSSFFSNSLAKVQTIDLDLYEKKLNEFENKMHLSKDKQEVLPTFHDQLDIEGVKEMNEK